MHFLIKASRALPSILSASAPTLQVSIFCSLVAAEAGTAMSSSGRTAAMARVRMGAPPGPNSGIRIARLGLERALPQRRGDITAVHGGHVGGRRERKRLRQERLRDVVCGHLAAEQ